MNKFVFDVENLPEVNLMVQGKAVDVFGCKDKIEKGVVDHALLFVDLDNHVLKASTKSFADYEREYGFGAYSTEMSVVQFLQLDPPPLKVALALVITDDLDRATEEAPRLVTAEELAKVDYNITRDDVMNAANVACQAMGV